jgi:hypothetical protein
VREQGGESREEITEKRYSFRGTKRKRIEGCGGFVPRNKGGSILRQGEVFWTLF